MTVIFHCSEDVLAASAAESLVDRFMREVGDRDWLREHWSGDLSAARAYKGLDLSDHWTSRSQVKKLAEERGIRVHTRLSGKAAVAYKCVRLATVFRTEEVAALLLSFDADGDPTHREGVDLAVKDRPKPPAVLVAEANPEFDAWVIAGFVPEHDHEHEALKTATAALKFNPVAEPHRLTSDIPGGPRDAKLLCQTLLGLSAQASFTEPRVEKCLVNTPLQTLKTNGGKAGLSEFLVEIASALVPALGGKSPA